MAKVMSEAEYVRALRGIAERDMDLLRSLRPGDAVMFTVRDDHLTSSSPLVYVDHTVTFNDVVIRLSYCTSGTTTTHTFSYLWIEPGSLRRFFPRVRPWASTPAGGGRG